MIKFNWDYILIISNTLLIVANIVLMVIYLLEERYRCGIVDNIQRAISDSLKKTKLVKMFKNLQ